MCSVFRCVVKMNAVETKQKTKKQGRITNWIIGINQTWDQIIKPTFNSLSIVFFAYFVACVP